MVHPPIFRDLRLLPGARTAVWITLGLMMPAVVLGQATLGARAIGMGQAGSGLLDDAWALFANPALMNTGRSTVSYYAIRYYGLPELTDMAATVTLSGGNGAIGLGAHRYGFDLFSESRLRVGYKRRLDRLLIGGAVTYFHITQGRGYGSAGAIGIDLGLVAELSKAAWMVGSVSNINEPGYGRGEEPLARELVIGFGLELSEGAVAIIQAVKEVQFPPSVRIGLETQLLQTLAVRMGVSTEPVTFAGGIGLSVGKWFVNLAGQHHRELGISPGFDLGIIL